MVQWGRLLVSDVRALGTFESPAGACRCSSVGVHSETEVKPQEGCTGFTMMTLATAS